MNIYGQAKKDLEGASTRNQVTAIFMDYMPQERGRISKIDDLLDEAGVLKARISSLAERHKELVKDHKQVSVSIETLAAQKMFEIVLKERKDETSV